MQEARRRIELILDPPSAELGAVYTGKVVNVTKFGAFVNILPGRDGLVHISKLGQGRRVERVEDVVDLGDEITVRVDDIDQQGKVSLSPVGGEGAPVAPVTDISPPDPAPASRGGAETSTDPTPAASPTEVVSFDDVWEQEAVQEFGDLGPVESGGGRRRPGGERGDRGDRGGRGSRRIPSRSSGPR